MFLDKIVKMLISFLFSIVLFCVDCKDYFCSIWFRAFMRVGRVYISKSANIVTDKYAVINFGKSISIGRGVDIIVTTEMAKVKIAKLSIGDGTTINDHSNIRASGGEIIIGKKCMIAQNVSIIATNHDINTDKFMMDEFWVQNNAPIRIGNDVWIGCGAVILPGVSIGNGAVIGAGSVVTNSIADNEVFAGVPAKRIKVRTMWHKDKV